MIDREFFNREAGVDFHEEKVQRLARHIGGHIRQFIALFKPQEVPSVMPVDEFPQEIMSIIERARSGAVDTQVRRNPHLSSVFNLLRGESAMINWEILSLTSEIALYATGNLPYALSVREYMKQQTSGADPFS